MAGLLGLSRAEQEGAKRLFNWSRAAHGVTLLASVLTVFAGERLTYVLAVVALVSEAAAWAIRILGDRRHSLAEEGRRRALIADALDTAQESLGLRDLGTRFSKRARRDAAAFDKDDYYAAASPPGLERLGEEIRESAFWSRCLYKAAAFRVLIGAGVLLAVVLVALFVVAGSSGSVELTVARVGMVFLSFLVFSDLLTHGLAWLDAADKSNEVYLRLATPLPDTATAIAIFGDYSVATATTPPIPTWLYERRKTDIQEAWDAVPTAS